MLKLQPPLTFILLLHCCSDLIIFFSGVTEYLFTTWFCQRALQELISRICKLLPEGYNIISCFGLEVPRHDHLQLHFVQVYCLYENNVFSVFEFSVLLTVPQLWCKTYKLKDTGS